MLHPEARARDGFARLRSWGPRGALLDAQLLADVWIAMTRGQETLDIMAAAEVAPAMALSQSPLRASLVVVRASAEELAQHAAMCERIERESKGRCLWMRIPEAA